MHSEITLRIAPEHPAFAGHFPGAPIVPGVLLLDAAVHALLEMLHPAAATGAMAATCEVSAAKFLSPVGPGEILTIRLDSTAQGKASFEISSGERKVATGKLVLPPAL